MAYTLNDLAALERAIALGSSRVKFQDRDQTFRSLEDMRSLRREIQGELGQANDKPLDLRYFNTSKGLK